MYNKVKEEIHRIKLAKKEISKRINNAPEGTLRCAICRGSFQYYMGKHYLTSKERNVAVKLAEKEYCSKLLKLLDKYLSALEVVEEFWDKEYLQNLYRELHPARKVLVEPIYSPVENIVEEFENINYVGRGFDEKDKTSFYTIKGERVRSKSEKIIADELYRHGISYKYELPIELESWNKKVTIYPDFTAINKRTGKKRIIEHLGMMDKMGYIDETLYKLETYEKNDMLIGRDVILLHETSNSPINTKIIEKYIKEYFD